MFEHDGWGKVKYIMSIRSLIPALYQVLPDVVSSFLNLFVSACDIEQFLTLFHLQFSGTSIVVQESVRKKYSSR